MIKRVKKVKKIRCRVARADYMTVKAMPEEDFVEIRMHNGTTVIALNRKDIAKLIDFLYEASKEIGG